MSRNSLTLRAFRELIAVGPKRAAALVEDLPPKQAAALFASLRPADLHGWLGEVDPACAAAAVNEMDPARAASVIALIDPQASAELFRAMAPSARQAVIETLPEERKQVMRELIEFPKDSAGRLMKTDVMTFPLGMKVAEVVRRLRSAVKKGSSPGYAYVVGPDRRLEGVLVMRDLLFAEPGALVDTVMSRRVQAVSGFVDREEIVRLYQEKRYLALPVVDSGGRLLGAVLTAEILKTTCVRICKG